MLLGCQADRAGSNFSDQTLQGRERLRISTMRRRQHVYGIFKQVLVSTLDPRVFRAGHRVSPDKSSWIKILKCCHYLDLGAPDICNDGLRWYRIFDLHSYFDNAGYRDCQNNHPGARDPSTIVACALAYGICFSGCLQRLFVPVYSYYVIFTQSIEGHAERSANDA